MKQIQKKSYKTSFSRGWQSGLIIGVVLMERFDCNYISDYLLWYTGLWWRQCCQAYKPTATLSVYNR